MWIGHPLVGATYPTLDEIVTEGARRMLAVALEVEVDAYITALADERDEQAGGWWCATATPSSARW